MSATIRQRVAAWLAPETRASTSDSYAAAFGIQPTASGQYVTPVLAEGLATVTACINAVAGAMAALPPYVYRRTAQGRVEAPEHPVARLTRHPNRFMTWPDLVEWVFGSVLATGNALLVIESDSAGRPTALLPVPWGNVAVTLLPSGRLAYDVTRFTAPWGGNGTPRRYLDGEVFHLKDRSDDGLVGRSRLSRAPEVLGSALALQNWNSSVWRNGTNLSGVVTVPPTVTKDSLQRMRAHFAEAYTGTQNAAKVLFADHGADFKPINISPEDSQLLESRRFTVEELARLYAVPGPVIGDNSHSTFTNSETLLRFWAMGTLNTWATKFAAEASRSIFGSNSDYELVLDLSGLLKGDPATRWATHKIAIDAGILDPDEVRLEEGWNPRGRGAPSAPAEDNGAGAETVRI